MSARAQVEAHWSDPQQTDSLLPCRAAARRLLRVRHRSLRDSLFPPPGRWSGRINSVYIRCF